MILFFLYVILFLLFTFVYYMYEIRSWHTNSYALGFFGKTGVTPKCGYDRYKRKKDGDDDNNADDENEPDEISGKKKKANSGAPVRVAWYFCIIPRLKRWFAKRSPNSCVGMTKAERSLRKMASLGTLQMQHNRVTLITTSHGLTKMQGAYGLL
jgi:hypothetical protein